MQLRLTIARWTTAWRRPRIDGAALAPADRRRLRALRQAVGTRLADQVFAKWQRLAMHKAEAHE